MTGICPNVGGLYEYVTRSEESDSYLRQPRTGFLTGALWAGSGGAEEERYKDEKGRWRARRFDYVRLEQEGDLTIKVSAGYGDEPKPRGETVKSLHDEHRTCKNGELHVIGTGEGGGEGFSSTISYHFILRKEPSGSILVVHEERESRRVAFIPTGSSTKTFTFRFKPFKAPEK